MRGVGYVYAVASLVVLGLAGQWALKSEARVVDSHIASLDGQRYNTAFPDQQGALARCATCHRVEPTGPERSAPPLPGILGAKVASSAWFGYSPALRAKGGSWTRDALDTYLANPTAAVPGTFKTLSPVADAAERGRILDALAKL
jgi:cytochrome c